MKKTLALTLALIMVLCLLPSVAFAKTDTITSSIATVTLDWKVPGLTYDVDVKIYLDDVQKAEKNVKGKGSIVGIALNIDDGYNYVYDKCKADHSASVTINSIASDGLSNGSKQAKYSGNLNLVSTLKTTTVEIYLKSRGSEAKPKNYDNIITNYVKRDDLLNKNHGFTHKVFEWRDDIDFTYYVERTPGVISNNFAAKLKFQKYDLQGKPVGSEDIAYAWNMHDIDHKALSITLASDNYWFETHCFSGYENKAFYTVDNVAGRDNQICFGSSALKTVKLENLPGYVIRAFPLNIPLTSEKLCTVKQVNKATDDDCCTSGHGKEMRYVKVYLNGQYQADADNTIGNNANAVYFPDRGVNMKESDIVVTNTPLGNQYYSEIVVKENEKTYEIHYYNYIYELNLNANGGSVNPALMTSGDQAVPDRIYKFSNLPTPTMAGYEFLGWADNQADADNGKVSYKAGDSLTLNYTNGTDGQPGVTKKTIYAVWQTTGDEKVPITLSYDGNGGEDEVTGVPTPQTSYVNAGESASFDISANEPTREGYEFLGWAGSANATEPEYKPSDTITVSGDTYFYAVWKATEIKPDIPTPTIDNIDGNIQVEVSCTSTGDSKTYGLIDGGFSNTTPTPNNGVYECTITVIPLAYCNQYTADTKITHTPDMDYYNNNDDLDARTLKLQYDSTDKIWKPIENKNLLPVFVKCGKDSHGEQQETTGTLIVKKTVESNDPTDKGKEFKFKVTVITAPNPSEPPIAMSANAVKAPAVRAVDNTATKDQDDFDDENGIPTLYFNLKDGDMMTISDLPVDYTYHVEELDFDGYTVTVNDKTTSSKDVALTKENPTETLNFKNTKGSTPTPTPTPYNGGGGNGGGYYYPTTTPVPVIVIPPKTGDMTVWQSILHFLGIR